MANIIQKIIRRLRKWLSYMSILIPKVVQVLPALPTFLYLKLQPENRRGQVRLLGYNLEYVDGSSLAVMFYELFFNRLNDFWSETPEPVILDCGSNVGVSVLRYKALYPKSKVTAFEADPEICNILQRNLEMNHAGDVKVVQGAVWCENGSISFCANQIETGRIVENETSDSSEIITVSSVRLRDFLDDKVDFLKMDIEGAELDVLRDCADRLHNVEKLIVELHYCVDQPSQLGNIFAILSETDFKVAMGVWEPNGNITDLREPFEKEHQYDQWPILYAWH